MSSIKEHTQTAAMISRIVSISKYNTFPEGSK